MHIAIIFVNIEVERVGLAVGGLHEEVDSVAQPRMTCRLRSLLETKGINLPLFLLLSGRQVVLGYTGLSSSHVRPT